MVFLLMPVMVFGSGSLLAQDEVADASGVYRDYFNSKGLSYDEAVSRFGVDNASTACFIASQSRVGIQDVYRAFTSSGNNWSVVLSNYHINPSSLFLPVPSGYHVGPPYGNAYGYWAKHKKNPSNRIVLSSQDVVNLANMNVIHVQLGTSVIDIMNYRANSRPFPWIVETEYGRTGRETYRVNTQGGHGHDQGNDNDQGKGHGKDKGHNKNKHN
jgi:hypothetical protein